MRTIISICLLAASMIFVYSCQENEQDKAQREAGIRSLRFNGRSYLENGRLEEAETAYKQLIALAPDDASAYANLALIYLRQGKYEEAKSKISKALKLAPDNPDIRMISARYFELVQDRDKAIDEVLKIVEQHPDYAIALYNLARLYDHPDDKEAIAEREKFLRKTQESTEANIVPRLELISLLIQKGDQAAATFELENLPKIFAEFPAQAKGFYNKTIDALHASDIATAKTNVVMMQNFLKVTTQYQSDLRELKGPDSDLIGNYVISLSDFERSYAGPGEAITDRIKFVDISDQVNLIASTGESRSGTSAEDRSSQFSLGDYDGDGFVDVYFSSYSERTKTSVKSLFWNRETTFQEQSSIAGIRYTGRESASIFADYNNDGYPDLYILRDGGNVLFKNSGEGVFSDVSKEAMVDTDSDGTKPLFLDADHDGDLDLLIIRPASNLLYRNNADGTFTEMAAGMGLGLPVSRCTDAAFADFDEDGDLDMVMSHEEGSNFLFSNDRHGRFTDLSSISGLGESGASQAVAVADYNNDGFNDLLFVAGEKGKSGLYTNKGDGTFKQDPAPWLKAIVDLVPKDAAFFDFDNDGFQDILIAGSPVSGEARSMRLFHNDSKGGFMDASALLPVSVTSGVQMETTDFDKDGDLDIFVADAKGKLHLLQNEGGNLNHYLTLKLVGLRDGNSKNNHFGIGAKVEIRSGELYQMKVVTEPVIHFGLGSRLKADVMRVTWTNGVAQNRFFPGTDQDLLELQSLKGSCAFLYTWDGERYVFSKDMMWRSALGMPLGIMGANTAYAPADPSKEYLKIPGEEMKMQDGKYIMQITEELWETAYFDHLELVVLDHPQTDQIFVDEKFTLPPYTNVYELYAVQRKFYPISAVDGAGTNLLPQILKKDDVYISNFQLGTYQGIAAMHDLILDPGAALPSGDWLLYLNGWLFPSDASINYSLGQGEGIDVVSPQLQVIDKRGDWVTVIPNLGFPMGKAKTMIVDLTGKFLTKDHRVRIRTNMEIYWDEIFFAPKAMPEEVSSTTLKPASADLHYRGFSRLYRKGGQYGPHWFDYNAVTTGQKWRDLIGNYTRFGEVAPLLSSVDDQLVIMNSGDEMTVTFDATSLPTLKAGWTRDFLIYSEGWIKDGDFNTAHGKTVEPLPFHAMTRYPYGAEESFPSDAIHQAYLNNYNTRRVNTTQFNREILDYDAGKPIGER